MREPSKRGVGLVYSPALHQLFLDHADLIDVVEIEPQTAWVAAHPIDGPFEQVASLLELWRALPQHKFLHSVGMPLAGLRSPSAGQMQIIRDLAREFGCEYVSEHLSVGGTPHQNAGFLLPPRQSRAGIEIAVRNIEALKAGLALPVAVETGVSYLPVYAGEIPDGKYVGQVAEQSDCGILLDIHNAYCNQRNGRQTMRDFVTSLPAQRVWELHIAGGFEREGYWLDAHSGIPPPELVAAAKDIVRGLPNLSAIIFEIYPSFLDDKSGPMLSRSLEILHELWGEAGRTRGDGDPRPFLSADSGDAELNDAVAAWESGLTKAVHLKMPFDLGNDLSFTPALNLYHALAHSFRASSLLRLLPRTIQLVAMCGRDPEELILAYEAATPAPLYALLEAEAFRTWIVAQPALPASIGALCDYEIALIRVPLSGKAVTVRFEGDPQPLFQALTEVSPPPFELIGLPWEIEILPHATQPTAAVHAS